MAIQHVPAWKRLGLKLKYANDHSHLSTSDSVDTANGRKRKFADASLGLGEDAFQLKKSKTKVPTESTELKPTLEDTVSQEIGGKLPRRKKSVSFTADTKVEDGDSAQSILFQTPDSPGTTPEKLPITPLRLEYDDNKTSSAKSKKVKKPKSSRTVGNTTTPTKASVAIEYLEKFGFHHDVWKFNKNHDTWLMKHALSTEAIDSSYNYVLAKYINGLQSIGARRRLVEQCIEILQKSAPMVKYDAAEMKDRLRQTISLDFSTQNAEQSKWLADVSRPKLILYALDEDVSKVEARSNGHAPTRVKKNKSRTSRIDIDSSSSDEDETSSSDDSESDTQTEIQKAMRRVSTGDNKSTNAVSVSPADDSSDSSSSSSSSSGDDADDLSVSQG